MDMDMDMDTKLKVQATFITCISLPKQDVTSFSKLIHNEMLVALPYTLVHACLPTTPNRVLLICYVKKKDLFWKLV